MTNLFITYNQRLKKKYTFEIKPNHFFKEESAVLSDKYYVQIEYEGFYNVTLEELQRYNIEMVDITEIYPYNTQDEKDYYDTVSPNKIVKDGTHDKKEMLRYNKVIKQIISNGVNKITFRNLIPFILDQLVFLHLTDYDRTLIFDFGNAIYSTIPEDMSQNLGLILEILNIMFENFTGDGFFYKIKNNRFLSEFKNTNFPIIIDTDNFKINVNYIFNNIPISYVFDPTLNQLPETVQEDYNFYEVNTNSYNIELNDENIAVNHNGPVTLNLPEVSVVGLHVYNISDTSGNSESNQITINTFGTDTILGDNNLILNTDYASVNIYTNGIDKWMIS